MTDNVVKFTCISRLPLDPKLVLTGALKLEFERVMVVGVLKDPQGSEYFAFSDPDGGTALWDMERARHALMKVADDE